MRRIPAIEELGIMTIISDSTPVPFLTTPTEISFPSADGSFHLYGNFTLSLNHDINLSNKRCPAILVVNGSGPIDRNGNVPSMHMYFNTANRFAEHVASRPLDRSIAVLSYDKRGVGKSIKKTDKNMHYRAGMMDLVSDAVEAVRFLSEHALIDERRIILLGHSEGAIILPLICNEVTKIGLNPILGCIFYSGFGENLVGAMEFQRNKITEEVNHMTGIQGWLYRKLFSKEKLDKQYQNLVSRVTAPDDPDFITMQLGFVKFPAKWLREHMSYNVNSSLQAYITCHCLAITGMKDVQVRNEFCEFQTSKTLVSRAISLETHRPKNLTHALRSLDRPAKLLNIKKDYQQMGKLPLDKELLMLTDCWCDNILFSSHGGSKE